MRRFGFSLVFIGLVVISSCSLKVPEPQDSMKGIVAIPIDVANRTSHDFSYYYKFICTAHPDVVITVFPSFGKELAYSGELVPGEYSFDQIKVIHKSSNSINTGLTKPHHLLNRAIIVNVQPSTITIANRKLVVEQYLHKTENRAIQTNWNLIPINDSEMTLYVNNFRDLENSNKWKIVSGTNSFPLETLKSSLIDQQKNDLTAEQKKDLLITLIASDAFTKILFDKAVSKGTPIPLARRFTDCLGDEMLELAKNTPSEKYNDIKGENINLLSQIATQAASTCQAKVDK